MNIKKQSMLVLFSSLPSQPNQMIDLSSLTVKSHGFSTFAFPLACGLILGELTTFDLRCYGAITLSFKGRASVLLTTACPLVSATVPYPKQTLTVCWVVVYKLSILMLYLHFMNCLSLNIFLVISSLNTFILNQASTRVKFHTQNFNSGTYAVFQEEQLGKGT